MTVLIQVLQYEGPIGQGASMGQWVQLRAAFKENQPNHCTVQVEHLAGRVAALLGLPCPAHALIELPAGQVGFVSLKIGDLHGIIAPATPPDLVMTNPDLCAGILAFDVLIGNGDRHPGNIAHNGGGGAPIIFDHSHALFTDSLRVNLMSLDTRQDDGITGQCLEPHIATAVPFTPWIERIMAIPDPMIRAPLDELVNVGLLNTHEADSAFEFLSHRRSMIDVLLRQQMPGLTDWTTP